MDRLLFYIMAIALLGMVYSLGRLSKCYIMRYKYDERWWREWKQYFLNIAYTCAAVAAAVAAVRLFF
ncbi:TPA: hypothetical protein DIU27_05230 [Candidatus Collierbacteria bacterium]|uniref:Uncharacterized protein n=1 Tax=Candidatus Collierbacteria bacterium GW2011_GWB2_44_22 TaxID=1618387 RepID=A0A0G1HVW3_9BACT|nr:MAG: hypothetical protein UW31_C0002G0017 [Candidatus Collierbacteria bacterium GW2011_GWA2_44_13]KKT51226.1 MAG: hypothetical protein UW44_C0014G0018 [Candidatus Collierbacteria bacterium GW2011_GWB2_44_22]KKT62185.1 MAG: hypothetical protein UW56_C0010G0017 [Candidatus Collierbacteria bacterium GW2011_GWD1_44_27]KKT65663.1 MAG: hypothetical protein UW58_C0023G0006 [Candidatus Collierbacteria bacterium GW2011_GWC2_44_30]KKT68804.1 MAG: hypothetical protein UW64_C0009G0016 [Microgenomates gr